MTTKPTKDTIYLEADDEITAIIDRVENARAKVVALVLPKRASVFQSAVNMKLLKKSADQAKKHLVLISSEDSIRAIAGVAGVYLANSLTSKPEIPTKPKHTHKATTINAAELEPSEPSAEDTEPATEKTPATHPDLHDSNPDTNSGDNDVISMGGDTDLSARTDSSVSNNKSESKTKARKKIAKIPDFRSFRTKLALGVTVCLLLVGGWVYGFVIAPEATVTINVNSSRTSVTYRFTADIDAESFDLKERVVPATLAEISKVSTAKQPASGQKNIGLKAAGTVSFSAQVCAPNLGDSPNDIAAGSTVESGGQRFVLGETAEFGFDSIGGSCANYETDNVTITAAEPGVSYNLTNARFSVGGRQGVIGIGTTTGGTDQIVKIVSADDIKNATDQLQGASSAEAVSELKSELEAKGLMVLEQTLEEGEPKTSSTPAEGVEASEVTVTQTTVYKMLGVKPDDLKAMLNDELRAQLEAQQSTKDVRDDGYSSAKTRVINKVAFGEQIIEFQTVAVLGEKFDVNAIAEQVAGKSRGEIQKMFESRVGVNSVDVAYQPAWVTTTPKKASKIEVIIKEIEN